MKRICFFLLGISPVLAGCHAPAQTVAPATLPQEQAPPTIAFVTFEIYRETPDAAPTVKLLKKQESTGQLKKRNASVFRNALTVYAYLNNRPVDSVTIVHPLYKHFEYSDPNGPLAVKDTTRSKADFFVRLQGPFDAVRVLETLSDKPSRKLQVITP